MTALDLDALKQRWQQQSARVDAKLALDVSAVRATLAARTTSTFQRYARRLSLALAVDAAALLALAAFLLRHGADPVYLLVGLAFAAIALAETLTDAFEWRSVRALDGSAPLAEVQRTMDALRSRRLRMTRWILLLSVLLWWPFLALVFKGLFGFDLLRRLHWSVAAVNLVAGLAIIPIGSMAARWFARRHAHSPNFQRFLDGLAGQGFDAARRSLETLQRFDSGVDSVPEPWPASTQPALGRLRLRLLAGIVGYALLLVATGLFNATHGGQAAFIVPGVLLNFLWVALMVAGIEHRVQLNRLVASHDRASAAAALAGIVAWRSRVAGIVLVLAPLFALALAQVLGKLIAGVSLVALLGSALSASLAAVAGLACAGLLRRARRERGGFAPPWVDLLCVGSIGATRALIERLTDGR
jgi:hypothetical protein